MKKLFKKFVILALISRLLGRNATKKIEQQKQYKKLNLQEIYYELQA